MFRTIPEFTNYQASNRDGEIRGIKGGRRAGTPLKHNFSHGYHYVGLYRDGKIHRVRVHRLVLSAWRGACPDGMDGLHRNDDRDNNSLSNLYWGTPTQNGHDAVRNGVHPEARKLECDSGHIFTAENTYLRPDGKGRQCRRCTYLRNKERRLARVA